MQVILVRHAHADPGHPDELRPLSARGREQARALGDELAALEPQIVLASPLLRARETGEALARAAGTALRVEERLAPGAGPHDLLAAVEGLDGPVVAVGHQPDCSEIAAELGAGDVDFPPAGLATLEL